jgi:hypothetical protein
LLNLSSPTCCRFRLLVLVYNFGMQPGTTRLHLKICCLHSPQPVAMGLWNLFNKRGVSLVKFNPKRTNLSIPCIENDTLNLKGQVCGVEQVKRNPPLLLKRLVCLGTPAFSSRSGTWEHIVISLRPHIPQVKTYISISKYTHENSPQVFELDFDLRKKAYKSRISSSFLFLGTWMTSRTAGSKKLFLLGIVSINWFLALN